MSIIVGFVPTPAGEAALTAGIAEARLQEQDLLIVNSAREGALVEKPWPAATSWRTPPAGPRRQGSGQR